VNRKLVMGVVAGLAVIALPAGGSTYAAFSDFADVTGNSVAAGTLKLDLGPDGTGVVPLDYQKLAPDSYTGRTIWIASSDGDSVPDANLFVTFRHLIDTPAACSVSLGKAQAELASGIAGCKIADNGATGTPAQGNLSRVLSFQGYYYPGITDPAECQALQKPDTYPANRTSFFASARGDLYTAASAQGGAGTRYELYSAGTTPLVLAPGDGGCIGISAGWIPAAATTGTPATPTDNAAQGDALSFDVRFDLVQV
jgi:predicted ribosomally synthesized peptide with SipW-like signal peptide